MRVLGYEDLINQSIDADTWRRLAVECLLGANREALAGSLFDWQTKIGIFMQNKIATSSLPMAAKASVGALKPKKIRPHWAINAVEYLPSATRDISTVMDTPVQTVHSVKGETHDITVFVCPDSDARHCPSAVWWSTDEKNREEKRIAYVAMTRTRGTLILCVSEAIYRTRRWPFFICKQL